MTEDLNRDVAAISGIRACVIPEFKPSNDVTRTGNWQFDNRVKGLADAHEEGVITRQRMARAARAYQHLREHSSDA